MVYFWIISVCTFKYCWVLSQYDRTKTIRELLQRAKWPHFYYLYRSLQYYLPYTCITKFWCRYRVMIEEKQERRLGPSDLVYLIIMELKVTESKSPWFSLFIDNIFLSQSIKKNMITSCRFMQMPVLVLCETIVTKLNSVIGLTVDLERLLFFFSLPLFGTTKIGKWTFHKNFKL